MNKEFIPYEQALALKELGFDESCYAFYHREDKPHLGFCANGFQDDTTLEIKCTAPLYQQAFRWFREKYGICSWIERLYTDDHVLYYRYTCEKSIESPPNYNKTWITLKEYNTYEEAELACLRKLIEIVEPKSE
jgi:hypothetical protein